MRLERTIAAYLTDRIPGLHAFKDDLAFVAAGNPYPYFLIDRISTSRKAVGTGIWDRIVDSEAGTCATKAVSVHQVLRFTIRAANTPPRNGNAVVADVCDQVETLLNALGREGAFDLPDPEGGTVHLERVIFQNRHDIAPIEKGMPFVYQQALTFLFVEQQVVSKPVAARIDKISISLRES